MFELFGFWATVTALAFPPILLTWMVCAGIFCYYLNSASRGRLSLKDPAMTTINRWFDESAGKAITFTISFVLLMLFNLMLGLVGLVEPAHTYLGLLSGCAEAIAPIVGLPLSVGAAMVFAHKSLTSFFDMLYSAKEKLDKIQ